MTRRSPHRSHVTRMAPTTSAKDLNGRARRRHTKHTEAGRLRTRRSRRQPRFPPSSSVCRGVSCRPVGLVKRVPLSRSPSPFISRRRFYSRVVIETPLRDTFSRGKIVVATHGVRERPFDGDTRSSGKPANSVVVSSHVRTRRRKVVSYRVIS